MNRKRKKCESISDQKLVQMDIFDSITKWKQSEKMKKSKIRSRKFVSLLVSPVVIEIDSDTEPEGYIDYTSSIGNRTLLFPFNKLEQSVEVEERNDKQLVKKLDSLVNITTTSSEIVNIGVNKPQVNSQAVHPRACSTPSTCLGSRKNNDHVGLQDLSRISANGNKTYSESDTDSDRTIIEQETTLSVQSVNIIDQLIIPSMNKPNSSNYSTNVTRPAAKSSSNISQKEIVDESTTSPVRKRVVAEEGIDNKRQKFNCTSERDKKHVNKKLFGGEDDTCSAPKKPRIVNFEDKPEHQELNKSNTETKSRQTNANKKDDNKGESVQLPKSTPNTSKENKLPTSVEEKALPESLTKANKVELAHASKDVAKCTKDVQTLNKAVSQPSPDSSQKEKVTENVSIQVKKDGSKDEPMHSNKDVPNTNKGKMLLKRAGENQISNKANGHPSCSSPEKMAVNKSAKIESKIESRRMNTSYVTLLQELFNAVYETKYIDNLLDEDRTAVDTYRDMKSDYQYVCIKLFTWKRKWYNIYKFCKLIHLDIGDSNISQLYNFLIEKGIVDTDFIKDDIRTLLELLDVTDLKSIRDNFKLSKSLVKKSDIIDALLKNSVTQSTLTPKKSTGDILMKEVEQRLGYGIRLNEGFYNAFYRAYVLATFANPVFSKMQDYFRNILHLRVAFPEKPIEEYTIFYSKDEFIRYVTARKYKDELEDILGKYHRESLEICKLIFEELQNTKHDENEYADRYKNTPHLARFTARAVYVSALSSASKILATKYPLDVRQWLEYMIKRVSTSHRIGEWYYHLSWLYMNYLEPRDYTHAAELIIEVLQDKREHLSEVQLHQLGKRGEALRASKKYKIFQLDHDRIAELVPVPIDVNGFPTRTIDATAIRSNDMGKKRNYLNQDKEGNKTFTSVEYIALKHYITEDEYTDGEHCEGSLIRATFTLFFWEIIYSAKQIIPGAFVSKIQSEPLDMRSKYFYLNRKEAIDKRLEEIEKTWSHSDLIRFVKDKYNKHSHLSSLCEVGVFIKNVELLKILVECIGRVVLSKIYRRYVKNISHYQSGLPDLLVWNKQEKKSKFVEVKGENDKLSVGQTLWLDYLRSIGADIEVCQVHSIGSKRKMNRQKAEKSLKPSTAPSNIEDPEFTETGSKPKKNVPKTESKGLAKPSTSSSTSDLPKHSIGSDKSKKILAIDSNKIKKIPPRARNKKYTEPSTSSSSD